MRFVKLFVAIIIIIRPTMDLWLDKTIFEYEKYASVNANFVIASIVLFATLYSFIFPLTIGKRGISSNLFLILKPFLFFLVFSIITTLFFGLDKVIGIADWLRLLTVLCFYVLVYVSIKTNSDIKLFIEAVVLSSVIPILIGLYQFFTNTGTLFWEFNRIRGTFVNPVGFGQFLVLILISTLGLYNLSHGFLKKLSLGWLGITLFCLYQTYTRGAWIGALMSFFFLGLVCYRRLLVTFPFIVGILPFLHGFVERFKSLTSWDITINSLVSRIEVWKAAISMFRENILLGRGLKSQYTMAYNLIGYKVETHSDYLRVLVETGIIGLFLYLWIIFAGYKLFFRAIKKVKHHPSYTSYTAMIAIFGGMLTAIVIMSSIDNILTALVLHYPLWGMGAIVTKILDSLCREGYESSSC